MSAVDFSFFFRGKQHNNTKKNFSVFPSMNPKKNRPSCFIIKFLCLFVLKMFVGEIDQGEGDTELINHLGRFKAKMQLVILLLLDHLQITKFSRPPILID